MSILSADGLSLTYNTFDIFAGISISVANDSKIGLYGPNGIGKTSLLMILAGIQSPTTGQVHLARGKRLGYLRQEAMETFADRSNTVYQEMLTVFSDLQEHQVRLHDLEEAMSSGNCTDALLDEYGREQRAFEQAGGYDYDIRIQQTLQGLGLGKQYWHTPLNHLSGGQKTRALLARLLLEKPDLLMLDEPTNHLDIEAVEWLEQTLRDWAGAVLIVSHDRYFLDNTVNTIWEMHSDSMQVYSGNYSAYLLQREERWDHYQRVFEDEKSRLQNEIDFVQRNWVRASTHARALGLLKQVSRELAIAEKFGIMALHNWKKWSETGLSADRPLDVIEAIRRVNALRPEMSRPARLRPRLAADHMSGTIVLRLPKVTIGYPGNVLFTAKEIELRHGECAGLIGPNGSGKTTFIRTLLNQLQPLQGEVQLGASLKIGYFAQAHDELKGTHSVLDELLRHKEMQAEQARSHLAAYLFREDDVFKPVNALSGGERARLALALLALDGANFLLLDEPTNHLDIPAQEALQEVLEQYPGTILLVSHDRFFIDKLATQIWDLREGKLNVFKGTYREYLLRRAAPSSVPATRSLLLANKPLLRGNDKDTRKRALSIAQLEERIHQQEALVKTLYSKLQNHSGDRSFEKMHELSTQAAQAEATLDKLMGEWEKLAA